MSFRLSGIGAKQANQNLFTLHANMQTAGDQPFTRIFSGTVYYITEVITIQRSGAASVLCAGGVYTSANRTGTIIIPAVTSYATLNAGTLLAPALGTVVGTNQLSATPILNLSVTSTTACVCDIYFFGIDLS